MASPSILPSRIAICFVFALAILASVSALAQDQPGAIPTSTVAPPQATGGETAKIRLESSESLFSLMAILNACGYDEDLAASHPLRGQIAADFTARVNASADARRDLDQACAFYRDHNFASQARNVSHYISLALELNPAPAFTTRLQEADLPPDASQVLGILPLAQRLYLSAKLHDLWLKYQPAYEAEIERLHDPVAQKIRDTDLYLRMPISGYLGRSFVVYVEPQASPGEVNARNYGSDYFLVLSPSADNGLKLDALRHIYLHYVLDVLVEKHGLEVSPLQPLLREVRLAPMDQSYKSDVALLVTESLIQAIEIRTLPLQLPPAAQSKEARRAREEARGERVDAAVAQGFVLTRYFYNALADFESGVAGFQDSFGDMLHNIQMDRELKFAKNVEFAKQATPEMLARAKPPVPALDRAEQQLFSGDPEGARGIAQNALDTHEGDPGQALYVLARAATMSGHMTEAQDLFQRTIEAAKEPRVIAWSHIYLGRIFDLQDDRDAALKNYQAALAAGDSSPSTKAAAQQGIAKAYEKPAGAGSDNEAPAK